jgi:DNA-binding NarL/FixJ family response regulator
MATHAFESSGFDSFNPARASEAPTALAPPAPAPVDEFVASRGWSCSGARRLGRPLSPRERQILAMIIDGKTRKEVAFDLEIADSTVRVIYSRAMKKLGGHWRPAGQRT